jgi:hypothetical protein
MRLPNFLTLASLPSTRESFNQEHWPLELIVSLRGEYGMGTMANELSLGCDCLGQIHYLVLSGYQIVEPQLNQKHSQVLTSPTTGQRS